MRCTGGGDGVGKNSEVGGRVKGLLLVIILASRVCLGVFDRASKASYRICMDVSLRYTTLFYTRVHYLSRAEQSRADWTGLD